MAVKNDYERLRGELLEDARRAREQTERVRIQYETAGGRSELFNRMGGLSYIVRSSTMRSMQWK